MLKTCKPHNLPLHHGEYIYGIWWNQVKIHNIYWHILTSVVFPVEYLFVVASVRSSKLAVDAANVTAEWSKIGKTKIAHHSNGGTKVMWWRKRYIYSMAEFIHSYLLHKTSLVLKSSAPSNFGTLCRIASIYKLQLQYGEYQIIEVISCTLTIKLLPYDDAFKPS